MKKRILSCLMALALCLTLLPTAALAEETEGTAQTPPAVEKAADPANGEAKQEGQSAEAKQEGQPAAPEQEGQSAEAKQENQPAEQEEQQEDSAAKQAVAAVQAMIDALPDAADLDGMDDAEAMEVYEAFQTACEAYYDTLSEKQQAQLKNTEKLAALSERFSQLETLAEGDTHTHCVCGKSVCAEKDHDNKITFGKWLASSDNYTLEVAEEGASYATGLNPESGKYVLLADKYYLQGNVTIKYPILIKGDVTICLNGQTIQSTATDKPVFEIVSGGKLTLTDCGSTGKVTRAYNGTGGGVEVNGGEFNLYGGSITKNKAAKGGGVKVTSGTVNMYGGEITDNTAAGSAEGTGNGGGVYMSGGTFHMRGGSITDNTTEVYGSGEGNGGGVYVYDGTFTMSDGKITGNTASDCGGGVRVDSNLSSTFTMSGGEISGNNKASSGGGVSVETGTFNMSGGKITGNTATKYGGGVHMLHGNFTVSGTAVIKDNQKGTAANNVHLFNDKFITVSGHLDGGASIGVTTEKTPAAGGTIPIATDTTGTGLTDGDAEKFESDLNGYAVSVNAEQTRLVLVKAHTHCICGGDSCNENGHTCHAVTFTAWTDNTKLPETKGEYYLDTDVKLSKTWTPAPGTVLCLNGHSIKADGLFDAITVNSGVTFTLTDCKGVNSEYGQITHSAEQFRGCGVSVLGGGKFDLYGGKITGNTVTNDGGGVCVAATGEFSMHGGEISGNTATNGGGVYVRDGGKFTMNGGAKISGNTAAYGGGVHVATTGEFNMRGGSITNNKANKSENNSMGGGVYVYGTFNMSGGAKISGNTAPSNGGGVYVATDGKFNMLGGTIGGAAADKANKANTAKNGGGGVYVSGGTFNMSGGSITGNDSNGVFVDNRATFTVSGAATVKGNTREGAASNVFLAGSKTITIGDELTGSPNSIGVTRGAYLDIANNVNEDYSGIFFSDKTQYVVKYKDKQLVLAEKDTTAETHTHCICGETHKLIGDHETEAQITFATKLWMDGGVLKKGNVAWTKGTVNRADGVNDSSEGYVLTAGSYYLENDLTLSGAAILIDGDVKLCLNGHTIDRANGNAALDNVIWVLGENEAHLTLTDCVGGGKLTGGKYGGVDIFNSCTLDMFGGTITGNEFNGGVNVGQFGVFNMYGGEITGNSARYGGGVYTHGKFTMSGGSITNNTATENGGGVLVYGGTFTVSGNVNITNNTVNNERNNVYLSKANKTVIGVTGALTGGARIGVTPETWPDGNGQRAIATGADPATGVTRYNMTSADMNCFQSDNGEYQTSLANNTVLLAKKGGGTSENIPVTGITLNTTTASLEVGKTTTLTATVEPSDATNKNVTWTSSDTSVATVAPDGTVTAVKAGTATITATAEGDTGKFATCTVTVTGGTTPSQPSNPGGSTGSGGSSSGGGGGSSSDRDSYDSNPVIKTETKNNTDGSTTKTETRRDGSVTQTTTGKDGGVSKTETKKDGSSVTENKAADGSTGTVKTDKNGQTEAKTVLSDKAIEDAKKNGEAVKAPVEVEASRNSSTAPTVKVELPKGAGETKVEIPVSNVKSGTVAVLVHPDGTEEILKDSIPTEDGIQLPVDGNATVKIVDNSKGFIDTRNHWAEDAIDFVSARGLVNGMSATIYAPNNSTTRAQLWTILARQNDADLSGGSIWYEKAQNWAKDKGVSDGANPNAAINRAQMVTMLWRAVGQPAPATAATFTDVSADAYYAGAVSWAVENGITTGVGGGKFDPTGACTRAQIAAFLTRLYAEK